MDLYRHRAAAPHLGLRGILNQAIKWAVLIITVLCSQNLPVAASVDYYTGPCL